MVPDFLALGRESLYLELLRQELQPHIEELEQHDLFRQESG